MPTSKPGGLASTMSGLWGLQVLAAGNHVVDTIQGAIDRGGGGGLLKSVNNFLFSLVRDAYNSIVGFFGPSVPGSFGWLEAAPSWLDQLFTTTYNTLNNHRSRILWLQNTFIRDLHLTLTADINNAHTDALNWADALFRDADNFILDEYDKLNAFIISTHVQLTKDINAAHTDALNWTNTTANGLNQAIVGLFNNTTQRLAS